jgi:hypothetical protein
MTAAERFSAIPLPNRPRAKSSTLSISADIRATLFCISPRISLAASFGSSLVSILAPAAIEAIGLRRSWPSDELLAQFRRLALA